jgi:hypothetical protein
MIKYFIFYKTQIHTFYIIILNHKKISTFHFLLNPLIKMRQINGNLLYNNSYFMLSL